MAGAASCAGVGLFDHTASLSDDDKARESPAIRWRHRPLRRERHHRFDLDQELGADEAFHDDERRGGWRRQVFVAHLADLGEAGDIDRVVVELDDGAEVCTEGFERALDVLEHLPRLGDDVAVADQLLRPCSARPAPRCRRRARAAPRRRACSRWVGVVPSGLVWVSRSVISLAPFAAASACVDAMRPVDSTARGRSRQALVTIHRLIFSLAPTRQRALDGGEGAEGYR